jgi:hypothetical protein
MRGLQINGSARFARHPCEGHAGGKVVKVVEHDKSKRNGYAI